MTYQQGALPPGQGYPGQGEQQMYGGGGAGGVGGAGHDGFGYQQQQPQQQHHQFAQQHDPRYQQGAMYGNGIAQGHQFYAGQQPQQGHYMQSHQQQQQQQPQQMQHQYSNGGMGNGMYQGYQGGYASPMQQSAARQFTPPANGWPSQQQQQQPMHQTMSMQQGMQQPMNQHSQSMHQQQQLQQQRQMQQQQQQQHAMQQMQQMRQQQQHQHHQSPQMYHNAIPSPQLQQRQQPSPSPRPQSMTAQHQMQQQFQRRISQSPIPQSSPVPRQMTPRQKSSTPQPMYHEQQQQVHQHMHQQHQQQSQQQHQYQQPVQQQTYQEQNYHQPSPLQQQHQQLQPSPQIHTQHQINRPRQQSTSQPPPEPVQELQQEPPQPEPAQPEVSQQEPQEVPSQPSIEENYTSQPSTDANEEQLVHDQLQGEQYHFVNLQDIQNLPPLPPMPSLDLQSIDPRDLSLPTAMKEPVVDNVVVKHEGDLDVSMPNAPPPPPPPPPKADSTMPEPPKPEPQMRIKTSPHSSVSNSPSITARSPSITKRSPAVPPKQRPVNTVPLMAAVAEECLDKARSMSHDVAMYLDTDDVTEYQKLIATGLSCLEALLQNSRLTPREEARIRLRYATVLHEETDNMMEAETALTKGISLCDKHRLLDLKYSAQYSMLKLLFHRNHKAALKAVDGHISNCEAFKHVPWYYAFRLLKASFYMEMGNGSDASALENIRAIQNVATTRGDNALSILASLWEGLALLKTAKEGSMEKVQSCIAQAAKYQFDPSVRILQLDILMLLLDFAASLHYPNPDATTQKLRDLQRRLDGCDDWNNVRSDFLVPIKKQSASSQIVSADTSAIIVPNDGTSDYDQLVVSFMTKMELRSLVFTFSGLASFHKQSSRSNEFWREGLKILETWDQSTEGIPYGPPVSLHTAIRQRTWRTEGQTYLCVLLGLLAASHCQWAAVKDYMDKLEPLMSEETQPTLRILSVYLSGVYYQGTGDLTTALNVFSNECFTSAQGGGHGLKVGQQEVALLAGLNRLWIMQHPTCRNDADTADLIEQLQTACTNHWNLELRTAWHNVMAALVTEPPQQLNQQKQHIQAAMGGSKVTNNLIGSALTLCIMRSRFFENVIGDQALKSARAAAKQAQRTGNVLWQSVADGMLAHSYDVQGQREESRQEWEKATTEARDAFNRS